MKLYFFGVVASAIWAFYAFRFSLKKEYNRTIYFCYSPMFQCQLVDVHPFLKPTCQHGQLVSEIFNGKCAFIVVASATGRHIIFHAVCSAFFQWYLAVYLHLPVFYRLTAICTSTAVFAMHHFPFRFWYGSAPHFHSSHIDVPQLGQYLDFVVIPFLSTVYLPQTEHSNTKVLSPQIFL